MMGGNTAKEPDIPRFGGLIRFLAVVTGAPKKRSGEWSCTIQLWVTIMTGVVLHDLELGD
jgi:hypothetical protein